MAEPPLTDLEKEIDGAAELVFFSGKTGYNWDAVDRIIQKEISVVGTTRCKKATGSGRAANVLTESNDKQIDLYVVFVGPNYSIKSFIPAATDRIKRFENVKTVAVADRSGGKWRVRAILEREGVGLAEQIRGAFPAVEDEDIHLVETEFRADAASGTAATSTPSVPTVAEEELASAMDGYAVGLEGIDSLPAKLVEFGDKRGVLLDLSLATDLLAATLSSQLLLFAGPSGTGKSTIARLLCEFFAPAERRFTIEALRQWLTPDDVVGYYSVLGRQYATTPDTATIIALHETSVAPLASENGAAHGPPLLLVEEMNLSAPEGYLAPVFHGLSAISESFLRWPLHSGGTDAVDEAAVVTLPETAFIGPYPRVLGTINVDASSHAPARKVAARSSVVLLEAVELTDSELAALAACAVKDGLDDDPAGEPFLGDPLTALRELDEATSALLGERLRAFLAALGNPPVSRRDATRCLAYMAYYRALSGGDPANDEETLSLATENAFLHCVLPTIENERFLPTLEALSKLDLAAPADSSASVGGLLGSRVERLRAITAPGFGLGGAVDFWSAMS